MDVSKETRIKRESIDEFTTAETQSEFREVAERGLWESEKVLIEKYFKPDAAILDVGCGSGRTTIPLQKTGYRVIGVDIIPEMIETAQGIAEAKSLTIDYRVGDATHLEFADDTFEGAIFANNGWAQIPGKGNRQKALNELFRVLKPNGVLLLTSHERYLSVGNFLFWITEWLRYRFGTKTDGVDYGDIFFERKHDKTQKQYIHMAGPHEVASQVREAGFVLVSEIRMGDVSKSDAKIGWGSLGPGFNSYKSPVFYICRKPQKDS